MLLAFIDLYKLKIKLKNTVMEIEMVYLRIFQSHLEDFSFMLLKHTVQKYKSLNVCYAKILFENTNLKVISFSLFLKKWILI